MAGISIGISQPTTFPLQYARFQRSYSWDVLLPDINIGLSGVVISQLVSQVSFGDYNLSTNNMKLGPLEYKYAGLMNVKNATMSLWKTMPDIVTPYFKAWKELIVDKNGLYQVKQKYAKDIWVRYLDSTGLAVGKYRLIRAFPVTFPAYDLNYDDNKVLSVNIEFSVDNVEYQSI
jgi:hypothetical protein